MQVAAKVQVSVRFFHVEDLSGIEDIVRIEGPFDVLHHFQFTRIGKFLHQSLSFIADAVFAGQAAAVGINEGVQFLLVGLDPFIPFFIGFIVAF